MLTKSTASCALQRAAIQAIDALPDGLQAYDCVLGAAIHFEGRGRRKLLIESDWAWLLSEFAATYGVRRTYASLAYLGWVVRYTAVVHVFCPCRLLTLHAVDGREQSSMTDGID